MQLHHSTVYSIMCFTTWSLVSSCHLVFDDLYPVSYFLLLKTDPQHHYFPYFHLGQTKITGVIPAATRGDYGPCQTTHWQFGEVFQEQAFYSKTCFALYLCHILVCRVCSRVFYVFKQQFPHQKTEDDSNCFKELLWLKNYAYSTF